MDKEVVCKQCSTINTKDSRFCVECGSPLQSLEEIGAVVAQNTEVQNTEVQNTQVQVEEPMHRAEAPSVDPVEAKSEVKEFFYNFHHSFCCFSGRLARLEYFIKNIILFVVGLIGAGLDATGIGAVIGIPLLIYACIASISLIVRRLHDMNLTGWLSLISLIPFVNGIFGVVILFMPGTAGANKYGEPRV